MDFKEYIKEIDQLYKVGNTTEHSFRGALASFLQTILKGFVVTNEPQRIECGAPDYVVTLKNVPVAFLEAKDINERDLDGRRENKEQFDRYKASLNRIVFTDYLDFHMYIGGEFIDSVRIAETKGDRIIGIPENEAKFNEMIIHLATDGRQRITSSAALACQMAGKAHLLADAVKLRLEAVGEDGPGEIPAQLRAFRNVLIHDLTASEFADIYAQTIAYGMFTARLNDTTPEDFSRQEAASLIPKSNPFLRKIFQSIAGYDLDEGISWIVDDLASMFVATDSERIMRNYGSNKRHSDPIVHFYEDFLAEYDPRLRKSRGVWYTPAPIVKFIVKSVDEILKTEFGLQMGLADDSRILVDHAIEQSHDDRTKDGKKHEMREVHRVQILDPATGTGTFLAEVIQQVRDKFDGMEGMWPSYVEKSLIPRIHGFEILMASYTIAHLKLSTTLKSTGYNNQTNQRLKVYLTNSLEEATPRADSLFSNWLSDEADEASRIKTETPVMICLGNPPYSISSANSGQWITNLIADYKKNLDERNIQPLSDDYIKFIKLGQHYINKNGEGVLAYISNNGFLDGIIHRQMRKSLLEEFDKIYVVNLHGNSRRKEVAPDGTPDENVFDIMQGVSINLFVKTGKKNKGELAELFYQDLYGQRNFKYEALDSTSLESVKWERLNPSEPYYFFVYKDFSAREEYEKFIPLESLFGEIVCGVKTHHDSELVSKTKFDSVFNRRYYYRPFDAQWIDYDLSRVVRHRYNIMKHMLHDNVALGVCKQSATDNDWCLVSVSDCLSDICHVSGRTKEASYCCPLYLYNDDGSTTPNIKQEAWGIINTAVGRKTTPEEVLHYVYAVLHSAAYRTKFKEFLKINFPSIPIPKSEEYFNEMVKKGAELIDIHLMKDSSKWPRIVSFPITGSNTVDQLTYSDSKVFINDSQYFGNISEFAWSLFIGGYQPAQKWLKDRKGRTLDYNDILHYGQIIYALEQTDRIMKEIGEIQ